MSTLSPSKRFQVLQRSGHACYYCGRKAPQYLIDVDHMKPRALGGTHHDFNLVAACQDCNRGKAAAWLDFIPRGRLSFSAREAAAYLLGLDLSGSSHRRALKVFHGMAGVDEVVELLREVDGWVVQRLGATGGFSR
jgi:hypothetical protein